MFTKFCGTHDKPQQIGPNDFIRDILSEVSFLLSFSRPNIQVGAYINLNQAKSEVTENKLVVLCIRLICVLTLHALSGKHCITFTLFIVS